MPFIVFIAAISLIELGISGSAVRPAVTFTPNWREIFPGETVTLTCDVGSDAESNQRYVWYKKKEILNKEQTQNISILSATVEDSGDYQCSAGTEILSYPVRLDVLYASLILQAPPFIFEGDPLTLRCHSWPTYNDNEETYFHTDNKYTQPEKHVLYIPNVTTAMTGMYQCTKKVERYVKKDETFILVHDIFVTPQIVNHQSSVTEGDDVALTCDTQRNPIRATTELQFAFYRDGRNVQEFSVSDTYRVPSAQLDDSGNYTCDVRTSNRSVRKRSNVLYIQIEKKVFTVTKPVLVGAIIGSLVVVFLISVLLVWTRRNKSSLSLLLYQAAHPANITTDDTSPSLEERLLHPPSFKTLT